jgi:hypothetical protein
MRSRFFSHAAGISLAALLALQGCATKTYGRLNPLTETEKSSLTCSDILTEITKVFAFTNSVNKGAQFSGGDVVAAAIDTGIGNEIEKKAALDSAAQRLNQLKELSLARKCPAPSG